AVITHTLDMLHSTLAVFLVSELPRCLFYFFFFYCSRDHRDLHSFPTRRSSDLDEGKYRDPDPNINEPGFHKPHKLAFTYVKVSRSEEHTSELQSRENLVCRLLLEKKKNKKQV